MEQLVELVELSAKVVELEEARTLSALHQDAEAVEQIDFEIQQTLDKVANIATQLRNTNWERAREGYEDELNQWMDKIFSPKL